MEETQDALDFNTLDALVADFVCAYTRLPRECSKSLHEDLARSPQESAMAKQVTTPSSSFCKESVPAPLTPRFEELEAEVAGRLERELPQLLPEGTAVALANVLSDQGSFYSSLQRGKSSRAFKKPRTQALDKLISKASEDHDLPRISGSHPIEGIASLQRYSTDHVKLFFTWWAEAPGEEIARNLVEPVMGVFILLNSLLTAISLDTEDWGGWQVVEIIFAGVYTIEICLKLHLLGWREMYFGLHWCWYWFDTLIVVLAIVDCLLQFGGSVTMFRILKLIRVSRLLRLIRLPILKELNMLIRGMANGARCLFWCIVFLSVPVLIIGMIMSQILKDWEGGLFSSVPAAMFTTLRCSCGDCTDQYGRPLLMLVAQKRGWSFAFFYSIFILVTTLGMFNLITSIFIEGTMVAARSDQVLQHQLQQSEDRNFSKNIKRLVYLFWVESADLISRKQSATFLRKSWHSKEFREFSLNDALNLDITHDSYQELVNKPDIREVLDDMGLRDDDIVGLFDMLDVDKSGTLDLNEVVTGLHRLRGEARKHDLVGLAYMIYSVQDSILRELHTCVDRLREEHDMLRTKSVANSVAPQEDGSVSPVTPRERDVRFQCQED